MYLFNPFAQIEVQAGKTPRVDLVSLFALCGGIILSQLSATAIGGYINIKTCWASKTNKKKVEGNKVMVDRGQNPTAWAQPPPNPPPHNTHTHKEQSEIKPAAKPYFHSLTFEQLGKFPHIGRIVFTYSVHSFKYPGGYKDYLLSKFKYLNTP